MDPRELVSCNAFLAGVSHIEVGRITVKRRNGPFANCSLRLIDYSLKHLIHNLKYSVSLHNFLQFILYPVELRPRLRVMFPTFEDDGTEIFRNVIREVRALPMDNFEINLE